jgi:hypothetical protein
MKGVRVRRVVAVWCNFLVGEVENMRRAPAKKQPTDRPFVSWQETLYKLAEEHFVGLKRDF